MRVKTRSGQIEEVDFSKIQLRLQALKDTLSFQKHISVDEIARDTINEVYDMISTRELDEHAARISAERGVDHPDYLQFAGAICVSNLIKETRKRSFSETVALIAQMKDHCGNLVNLLDPEFVAYVDKHGAALDTLVDDSLDYRLDYIGIKTLMRSYLIRDRVSGRVLERPQHMYMRVAVALHMKTSWDRLTKTYNLLGQGLYTHATPTLYNAGTKRQQLASCFLGGLGDSIQDIYKWLGDCAQISKFAGGIGMHVHNIRATGSLIHGTNGVSNGIVPMLQVFNASARYVDQGGGKRKGSIAVYLEPWHADIEAFLSLKTNVGDENMKARDLFLALWIPDLFMKRVRDDGQWSLMCPSENPGLSDCYGAEFEELYTKYEKSGRVRKTLPARELFRRIMEVQIETGVPYMCYKDAANEKSNQKNLGVIKSSNLCSEIIQYSDDKEYAVCNLASINLSRIVKDSAVDYQLLHDVAYEATRNLDRVIDLTYHPCEETRKSNDAHRPMGLGVQGLADVFFKLKIAFDSPEAKTVNKFIFETIYHAAVNASADMAAEKGSYSTFEGSPFSKGIFQHDMWENVELSGRYDWDAVREKVLKTGMRNSLLTAVMPTASTAMINASYECIEPPTSNIYTRRTIAGTFTVPNKYLVKELSDLGLWSETMRNEIIRNDGSIQQIAEIPEEIRLRYKTVWELSQKVLIDLSADRGPFIDQSQSLNLFMGGAPNFGKLYNMHLYGWQRKLKTSMYYLRSQPASQAIKFSISETKVAPACSRDQDCESCSA